MDASGATIYPYGGGDRMPGVPIGWRNLRVEPDVNMPAEVTAGRRKIMNPQMGMDEVGQIQYTLRGLEMHVDELYDQAFGKWSQPGKNTSAKNRYYYWKARLKNALRRR